MTNSKSKKFTNKPYNSNNSEQCKENTTETAISSLRQALLLNPENSTTWYNLGLALHNRGELSEAEICYQQALQRNPQLTEAWNALGDIALEKENFAQAIDFYEKALALAPNAPNTRHNLSWALSNFGNLKQQQGYPRKASVLYRKALGLNPNNAAFAYNLGLALETLGDFENAEKAYRSAITNDPKMIQAYGNLGNLLREIALFRNDSSIFAEASKLYRKALSINPEDQLVRDNQLRLKYLNLLPIDEAVPRLTKEITALKTDFLKWRGNLLLSQLLDKAGLYELAFNQATLAHRILQKKQPFSKNNVNRQIDRLIKSFSAKFLSYAPRSQNRTQKPVFIVGMPRSGTTLVEQILSAHPKIEGIGEKPYIVTLANDVAAKIGSANCFPECITGINRDQLSAFSKEQEEHLEDFSPKAKRICNKLPTNLLYLGLISLIFPKARIIHCQRRPSDTIISIFLQNFINPLEYSHKIEDIIFYYHEYLRLMEHWRQVIDLEMLETSYEELVLEQEKLSRKFLKFVDLEWHPACLEFYRQPRLVLTASRDQVKRPIYRSSLERWRNYEKQLAPWLPELKQLDKIAGYPHVLG